MRISDWSSDVCSSDLAARRPEELADRADGPGALRRLRAARDDHPRAAGVAPADRSRAGCTARRQDRKSVVSGKSESVRVDLGGRRIIKKKNRTKQQRKQKRNCVIPQHNTLSRT